ncbi:hypothetical protein C2E23DRAFT_855469 [Lenzites betulinus]|nr:hypothetical protein C2E23DRAFT_855469 [Lenzites betulinus]
MRVSTLSAFCATALIIPVSAVPLGTTTAVSLPIGTMNVILTGPTEIPNLPVPVPAIPMSGAQQDQVQRFSKAKFPKSKLSRLPRGASFRQADYGVNHNVTLVPIGVQGVEAVPTPSMPSSPHRRSDENWEASGLEPDYAAAAAPSPPSGDVSEAATDDPSTDASSGSGSPAPPPLALGDPQKTDLNHIPVHPNFQSETELASQGISTVGGARYKASYSTHDALGGMFDKLQPATAKTSSLSSLPASPAALSKLSTTASPAHGLLGRMLEPARYMSAPLRRAFSLAKGLGLGTHTMQLDTNALAPAPTDPTLNMSDPYVAQEEMRRQHTGLLNLDSNRPAPPPPAAALPSDTPLNATSAAPTELADGAGGAKNATALPVDDAARTPVDKTDKKAEEKADMKKKA